MGMISHFYFVFKIALAIFIAKKVARFLLDKIFNFIIYLPNMPSEELKRPECNPDGYRNPGEYGFEFEDLKIATKDGASLHGWFLKQKDPLNSPTIIFFHGNAGNIGNRLPNMQKLFDKCKANIAIIDYRGYGNSTGFPSETGLKRDAEAVLNWALKHDDISKSKLFVFGRSLGAAVAISLANSRQSDITGLIIENTFTDISKYSNSHTFRRNGGHGSTKLDEVYSKLDCAQLLAVYHLHSKHQHPNSIH